jgi:hypothetical protein
MWFYSSCGKQKNDQAFKVYSSLCNVGPKAQATLNQMD